MKLDWRVVYPAIGVASLACIAVVLLNPIEGIKPRKKDSGIVVGDHRLQAGRVIRDPAIPTVFSYVTEGSTSIDFPHMATDRCAPDVVIPVLLVKPGDYVVMSVPRGTPEGVVVTMWASAEDAMTVRACNANVMSIDPAVGTYGWYVQREIPQ